MPSSPAPLWRVAVVKDADSADLMVAANGEPPLGLRLVYKLLRLLMRHVIQTEKELMPLPPSDQPGGHSPVADDMLFTSSAHAAADKERSRRLLAAAKEHGVKGSAVSHATAVLMLAAYRFKVPGGAPLQGDRPTWHPPRCAARSGRRLRRSPSTRRTRLWRSRSWRPR
jgi:hypothetical protein